jgi:hypothetical protein
VLCHAPLALHVCGCWLAHCTVPGAHTPWHAPPTHAWFVHATGALHDPPLVQVSTPLPEHCTDPVVHVPEQTPATHVAPEHAAAVPH